MRARTEIRALGPCAAGLMVAGALAGCSDSAAPRAEDTALPQGSESVELDPADFTVEITNPWWPMEVGDRWAYEETDGDGGVQQVEVTVLDVTYTVAAGIEARAVHDLVTKDGATVEDTLDWYAQDAAGNVWYVGEKTAEYEDGKVVTTEGSWEAGVDGAQAGVLLPAEPEPRESYRQEYLEDEAEDEALVLSASEQVEVPTGRYADALLTRETTPLEPEVSELKFYAPGVGPVLTVQVSGGAGREELVETTRRG